MNSLPRRTFLQSTALLALSHSGIQPFAAQHGSETVNDLGFSTAVPGFYGSEPGIQIGTQMSANASEEDMMYARQLGVEWIMTGLPPKDHTLENYQALIKKFGNHGLKIYRLGNSSCHNMEEVTLNLSGRDEKVEEYLNYIRLLGKAGIHYSTYAHMGNGIWSSDAEEIRGGATGRALRLDKEPIGYWNDKRWKLPLSHGRKYTEEEIWDNFIHFVNKVVPVAEESNVYIGVHPDDPPVYDLGGIPRCIFGTFDGYKRAIEIADSPNYGVCLCVGSWLEGGEQMGGSAVEAARYFAERKKLFKVHFRNVTAPLPEGFTETLLDDGYMNMYEVVKALHESGYNGAIISDHVPKTVGGRQVAEAFSIGYIKGLIQAART